MADLTSRIRRRVGPIPPGLRQTFLLALLCNLLLELSRLFGVDGAPWRFKTPAYVLMFLLGTLVLWALVGLVHAVVGRIWLTAGIAATATVVVAVADYQKVHLRREPLYPGDWAFVTDPGFLVDMVGVGSTVALLAVAVSVGAVAVLVARRAVRRQPTGRRSLLLRAASVCICLLCLVHLAGFNSPGNAARATYDALGASWRPWSQLRNYLGNGFVGGYLYNLALPAVAPPPGYGEATMARIAEDYAAVAERINRDRDPHALDDVNVVMLLSESFSDPQALEGVQLASDPIPFVRSLMERTTSGDMMAQGIGGGTANMEFEALTGMSLSLFPPQARVPYQMLVPEHAPFPSVAGFLERAGHRTLSIHPYTTEMYRRSDVYRAFGIDTFVHQETMHDTTRVGHDGYISDGAAFDELTRSIDIEDDPLFVNLVTMQNHVPYHGMYDDPARVAGPDGESLTDIGQYVSGIMRTDAALRELVHRLRQLDERTVVVFYGDHLPGTYPSSVLQRNSPERLRRTPFFVWTNWDTRATPQPVTSPSHFVDLMLEQTDAAVSPYYALLQELRHQIPAMDAGMLFGPTGEQVPAGGLPAEATRLLRDYRLVQHDLAVGRRYSADTMLGVR